MFIDLPCNVLVPARNARKGPKVPALKVRDHSRLYLGVDGHCVGLAKIIGPMTEHLVNVPEGVMTVERTLGEFFVLNRVACPGHFRAGEPTNIRMKVARFAGIEIFAVMEEVPDDSAYRARLGLFEVDVGELVSGVGDEYASEAVLNILEIRPSSKLTE
jgi:hypothetical protein